MNNLQQQQFINDLLVESFEGLDRFDRELLDLENGRGGTDVLHSIFRIIHTLKGTSGCLGLKRIQRLAHAGENLLDLIRNGNIRVCAEIISALLKMSDALREMLKSLEKSGTEGAEGREDLIGVLQSLQVSTPVAAPTAAYGLFEEETPAVPASSAVDPEKAAEPASAMPGPASEAALGEASGASGLFEPSAPTLPKEEKATETPVEAHVQAAAVATGGVHAHAVSAADSGIRVDISLLDRLMNLVGELVLARNQIVQHAANNSEDGGLSATSQRLNIITTELQEGVMKTRMQPIGGVWAKYPRIVRDVSQELNKKVRLEMEGQETELDRTIIESIKDPLTHIIRNSIDHGIETPEQRVKKGKSEEGLLHLRAFHEGGQVNIEVTDDGAGIHVEKVKKKALEKGLVTAEQLAHMGEREALSLIFLPGLSTAEKITNVSGRGVGMDVVKTNIEKIGGSVDIQSSLGEGTTLRIKIPLTLAIIPALVITSRGERFAIPQVSLVELVRLDGDQSSRSIEYIFDAPVYRLRGKLLPLVYLNQTLRLGEDEKAGAVANIVVLKAGEQQFGLVVDTVNDTQEIVVKPLGKHLKGLSVFAGATIMGDGRVALILDVFGLAQHAHVVAVASDARQAEAALHADVSASDIAGRQSLLVFSLGIDNRLALPLSSVGRLERFAKRLVEREGTRDVIQYRGQIMPLLQVSDVLGMPRPESVGEDLSVVVYKSGARNLGLVVGNIEDIVEDNIALDTGRVRPGISGSAVIHGKVTEMVDVPAMIHSAGI